jgi:hypothetical protein
VQALNGALEIRPRGPSQQMQIPGRSLQRANEGEMMTGGNVADL